MPKQIPLFPAEVISLPQPPARKAEDYLKAYNGYTYSAVSAIASEVASINLKLLKRKFTRNKVEVDEILEHPALSLLHYANTQMTHYDLIEATQIYLDLVGEAFWVLLRENENGEPVEIWPVRPDWMKVKPSNEDIVDSYIYNPGGLGRDSFAIPAKDVVHFRYFNPINPYRGKGTVQAAAMPIDIHTFAQEYNRNFFFNSAMPGMVFTTEQKLSQEVLQRFSESWQQKFGGRNNSNKVAFLSGGFKTNPISQSAKEMDFKEMQNIMRNDILATFKVPRTIIGLTDDVNRSNAEATTRAFMERVVTPRMKKFVAHLNEFFLINWSEDIFFDFDDPAPEDTELKLKIYESGLTHGWLTRNEVREQENLPPVEGGDVVYIPFGQAPLGSEPTAPKPGNQQEGLVSRIFGSKKNNVYALPVKKTRKKKERKLMVPIPPKRLEQMAEEKLKGELRVDLVKLIGNMMANGKKKNKKNKSTWDTEKRNNYWYKLIAKTDVQEHKMKSLVIPLFNDLEKEITTNVDNLKHYALGRRKGKESSLLFDLAKETSKWVSVIIPFEREIMLDTGAQVLDFLGTGGQLDPFTDNSVNFIRQRGTEAMRGINETTREALRKTLADGLEKGESIDKLKSRVSSVFTDARGIRADRIARTEVLTANNFASNEAYKQSGIVKSKEWLTALDERVTAGCRDLDGDIVKVDSLFKSDVYGNMKYPPAHVMCRCTTIPVL